MEISALLYSTIAEIGKERIRSDIAFDIAQSKHYLEMIMNNCKTRIDFVDEDTVGSLCAALLHFMLTVSILHQCERCFQRNYHRSKYIRNKFGN